LYFAIIGSVVSETRMKYGGMDRRSIAEGTHRLSQFFSLPSLPSPNRFFAAFEIAALPAADRTHFFAPPRNLVNCPSG
jgi:hypothetical protein